MATNENRSAPELNEKEVNELLENFSHFLAGAFLIKQLFHSLWDDSSQLGYEMILANSALRALLATYHLISNARSWNNNN